MAKKAAPKKEVKRDYLFGTFACEGEVLTIDANTPAKEVESFLKKHKELEARVTDAKRIEAQRKLMQNG